MTDIRQSMDHLRRDALERGMWDLALVYGEATLRIGDAIARKQALEWARYYAAAHKARRPSP